MTINSQKDLINSFIELNPSIEISKRQGRDNTPIEDLASKSELFPDTVITENLAYIFKRQGKIEQAITIYKKLIEKIPRKKTYFTFQIKKLKEE